MPITDNVAANLTPEEDAVLRRLHWFERFGVELAPSLRMVKDGIRSRDKRDTIREPEDFTLKAPPTEKAVS